MHDGALIGYFVSRLRRVPLVFDYQGSLTREMIDHQFLRRESPLYRPVAWLERTIDGLADVILTSSTNAAEAILAGQSGGGELAQAPQGRRAGAGPPVAPLLDGVDVHAFDRPDAQAVAALRARYGIPPERLVVGYVGLLAEYQGVGDLIYAARRVIERRPDTHFLIMGYPGLERYRRQAHDLQILDHVTFTGRVAYEQCPLHLGLADVAVSAKRSASEANGKLLNYMAMGLPTVAYETPVARELLGERGTYAPSGDVAALAEALLSLLDSPQRRSLLGAALRERARRRFSWDGVAARLESVYEGLSAGRSILRKEYAPRA
jgi:glycosyltransferase involved in cell wall biosynthesis